MRRDGRATLPLRFRASLVSFVAVLAFLVAALRTPTIGRYQVGGTAPVAAARHGGEETPKLVVKSVELGRVPAARPSRGDATRPPRADRALYLSVHGQFACFRPCFRALCRMNKTSLRDSSWHFRS